MSDRDTIGQPPSSDAAEQARRLSERMFVRPDSPPPISASGSGISALDLLLQGQNGQRQSAPEQRAPWTPGDRTPPLPPTQDRQFPVDRFPQPQPQQFPREFPSPIDRFPQGQTRDVQNPNDRYAGSVSRDGVLKLKYGEPDFDGKLSQTNYKKLVIEGLPKDMQVSPWIDEKDGKGFLFWFKNKNDAQHPELSDRTKHFFPSNVKSIEIAQFVGNVYKPTMINADEMRIAASQTFMRSQNNSGFASYGNATDIYTYAANMSKIAGSTLDYQEKLLREGAKQAPDNPYFRIYLSDVLTAEAVQPVLQDIANGKTAYFDNPYTKQKLADAATELNAAMQITHVYGNLNKPPSYEIPLSPFSLNPYSYNPDFYWSGAAYQAQQRQVQLMLLQKAVVFGKLPFELPPALPPKQ